MTTTTTTTMTPSLCAMDSGRGGRGRVTVILMFTLSEDRQDGSFRAKVKHGQWKVDDKYKITLTACHQ